MRTLLHCTRFIVLLVILLPVGVFSVQAQEANYPVFDNNDSEDGDIEREKVMYSPGEGETQLNSRVYVSPGKDTSSTRPLTIRASKPQSEVKKSASKPTAPEDDSILSFNFLYYMFEKYKWQDIVD